MLEAGLDLQQAPPIDSYDQWNGMTPIIEGSSIKKKWDLFRKG